MTKTEEPPTRKQVFVGEVLVDQDQPITVAAADGTRKAIGTLKDTHASLVRLKLAVDELSRENIALATRITTAEKDYDRSARELDREVAAHKLTVERFEKVKAESSDRFKVMAALRDTVNEIAAKLDASKEENFRLVNERSAVECRVLEAEKLLAEEKAKAESLNRDWMAYAADRETKLAEAAAAISASTAPAAITPDFASHSEFIELQEMVVRQDNLLSRLVQRIDPTGLMGIARP